MWIEKLQVSSQHVNATVSVPTDNSFAKVDNYEIHEENIMNPIN